MLDFLAEQRLQEAVSRGELDDDPLVPEDLRVAYLTEIGRLERLVAETAEAREWRGYDGFAISAGPWMSETFASAGTGGTLASHAA